MKRINRWRVPPEFLRLGAIITAQPAAKPFLSNTEDFFVIVGEEAILDQVAKMTELDPAALAPS